MSGWIFGGWPPPAPGLDSVTFDEVKAALALANTPVGFNTQRITDLAAGVAGSDAATVAQVAAAVTFAAVAAALAVATTPVAFNTQRLTGVDAGVGGSDAVNLAQLAAAVGGAVTFAAVKAALALASSSVGFNSQPLVSLGRSAARDSAALVDSSLSVIDPAIWRPVQSVPVLVPAAGSVTIPSPAAGFIRIISSLTLTSLGATPNYNITLQPSGLFIASRALTGGAATAANILVPSGGGLIAFGAAETIQVANGGTANATLFYVYQDVADTNLTLVRAQYANVGNPAVVVIPAAPAGFVRRLVWAQRQLASAMSINPVAYLQNDDTAAVVSDWTLGASPVFERNASVAAGANTFMTNNGPAVQVTTQALSVQAQAAATDATRRPVIFGLYETVPL